MRLKKPRARAEVYRAKQFMGVEREEEPFNQAEWDAFTREFIEFYEGAQEDPGALWILGGSMERAAMYLLDHPDQVNRVRSFLVEYDVDQEAKSQLEDGRTQIPSAYQAIFGKARLRKLVNPESCWPRVEKRMDEIERIFSETQARDILQTLQVFPQHRADIDSKKEKWLGRLSEFTEPKRLNYNDQIRGLALLSLSFPEVRLTLLNFIDAHQSDYRAFCATGKMPLEKGFIQKVIAGEVVLDDSGSLIVKKNNPLSKRRELPDRTQI